MVLLAPPPPIVIVLGPVVKAKLFGCNIRPPAPPPPKPTSKLVGPPPPPPPATNNISAETAVFETPAHVPSATALLCEHRLQTPLAFVNSFISTIPDPPAPDGPGPGPPLQAPIPPFAVFAA